MEQLTLPAFDYKLKDSGGKTCIYDVVRKKWLVLTPEEWVRQHVIHFLHKHLAYPLSLMGVERGTTYNTLQKRTDLCIYSHEGTALLLVECKAPHVPLTSTTVQQAAVYNQTIQAPFLFLSNGLQHYCWQVGPDGISLSSLETLPTFAQLQLQWEASR
ncbi:restriction endonuclease subunit R [Nibribacter ruber]|uniref:Restriction endonuclease subunit R n=1 Tax=Nibribacter ruber TaxID=2698458 RepID=A0A6P1NY39_9BACT|nr:type I restriction enzyme HsdR N-terminal domain-containing protein [Nibribacter ruber]QHL86631.1 restriction endonuclease subunit R [Nibribacter ruber]